jgi:uncharacterized protein YndB with AHSA1/START domain
MNQENKLFTLNMDREFSFPPEAVFGAIEKGILFLGCGAKKETMRIDFKVGGTYSLSFGSDGEVNCTFTEIIPNHRVSFTWSHNKTRVSIELEPKETGTMLRLKHDLIPTAELVQLYRGGWEDGIKGIEQSSKKSM